MVHRWNSLKEQLDEYENLIRQGATKQEQARPILNMEQCRNLFMRVCSTDTYNRVPGVTKEQNEFLDHFEKFRSEKSSSDMWFQRLVLLAYDIEKVDLLLQRSAMAKRMLTGRLLNLLTDLSIVIESVRQIHLWLRSLDAETGKIDGHTCKLEMRAEDAAFFAWYEALDEGFTPPLSLITPVKEKLPYPEHKKRTSKIGAIMRESENRLDRFWSSVDTHFKKKTGATQHGAIHDSLEGSDAMYGTAPWVDSSKTPLRPATVSDRPHQPILEVLHDRSAQVTGTFDRSFVMHKVKPKTRGVADTRLEAMEDLLIQPVDSSVQETKSTFQVRKRAHKVFRALFSSSLEGAGEVQKSLKWIDFTYAMNGIGFSVERLQGSAWQFTPGPNISTERGIHFHAPHPDSDITYVIAKRMGRRLGRVYGWHGDTFQLA
ncbi:hypothetical protein SLS61_006459 [Didymella pomorum]